MAERVEVKTALTPEELRERYRKASEPVERTQWHILGLMKEGYTPNEVAQRVGYTARWVRTIVGRYNRPVSAILAEKYDGHIIEAEFTHFLFPR